MVHAVSVNRRYTTVRISNRVASKAEIVGSQFGSTKKLKWIRPIDLTNIHPRLIATNIGNQKSMVIKTALVITPTKRDRIHFSRDTWTTLSLTTGGEAYGLFDGFAKLDNGSDHRVRTEDIPFQKHAQAGLRVHRIVIPRFEACLTTELYQNPTSHCTASVSYTHLTLPTKA